MRHACCDGHVWKFDWLTGLLSGGHLGAVRLCETPAPQASQHSHPGSCHPAGPYLGLHLAAHKSSPEWHSINSSLLFRVIVAEAML